MTYYFVLRSGVRNQIGREYVHWEWSKSFKSKDALRKHFSHGMQKVRASEILSSEQLVRKYSRSPEVLRSIIEEAIKYSGKNGSY